MHGNMRLHQVRYRVVTERGNGEWNVINSASLSVELPSDVDLINDEFYELTVDARNEVGFNDSLHLESIILPTNATGTCAAVPYIAI